MRHDVVVANSQQDNQWPVNFNWPLQSFRPQIHGVVNLTHLAHASRHNTLVLFVSSVSAVASLPSGTAPETPVHDVSASAPMGYGRSKLLAEILLDRAAQRSGIRSAVCRVGIVAGPVESTAGMWNRHEYIPSVSASSVNMSLLGQRSPLTADNRLLRPPRHLPSHIPLTGPDRLAARRQASHHPPRDPTDSLNHPLHNRTTTTKRSPSLPRRQPAPRLVANRPVPHHRERTGRAGGRIPRVGISIASECRGSHRQRAHRSRPQPGDPAA